LAKALGHEFANQGLLDLALTHRSAGSPHNERLEFLGDAILDFVVSVALYERFSDADEGQLSRLRAMLVRRDSLAQRARELELGAYLSLGSGEMRTGGHARDSILADALEAVLAAVFLDAGYAEVRDLILRVFRGRIDGLRVEMVQKDSKTRLQEYLQAKREELPVYEVTAISGAQHAQRFTVTCSLPGTKRVSSGEGGSRRLAEQAAAQAMLEVLLGEHGS